MIKGSIQEENITPINICAPNIEAPKCIKKKNILTYKGRIENTIIVGDFNTPLTSMDRYSRQNFSKTTEILNDIKDQLDLIAIFMTLHQKKKKKAHSFQMHIEYSLGSTTCKDTKQASANLRGQKLFQASILTHNTMKLEVNHRKRNEKK